MLCYKFKRGEEFIVYVQVSNMESLTFHNITYPENTPTEVLEQFLIDAETAVLKKLEEGAYDNKSDAV